MRVPRSALLLVGSPKAGRSASGALGEYLLDRLAHRGLTTEMMSVSKAYKSPAEAEALCAAVDAADLVVLASPLYVDSLPAPVMKMLEIVAEHRRQGDGAAPAAAHGTPALVAIVQSGFPEADHNAVALAICRAFACAAGLDWRGGLAMGGGGMTDGRPLGELGGMMRQRMRALDLAAAALAAGQAVPDEAVTLMSKLPIPAVLYRLMGDLGWRRQARSNGARRRLRARPFAGG
jgi:hypothetical protein